MFVIRESMSLTSTSALSFSEKLERGLPVITLELSPPRGSDVSTLIKRSMALKGKVDAINVPDCQRSILKMSSLVASKLIEEATGIETVWQLTCRDRNLIALQADLLGGDALGLRNILALTGDPVQVGDQKEVAKQVFHLDSVRLLDLIRTMNAGKDATGKDLKQGGTRFCPGGALNPFRIQNHAQQMRIRQKLERGLLYFQTQPVYDPEPVEQMMALIQDIADQVGVPRPRVLIGIIPPRNAEAARFMNSAVAGINIPQAFVELLERSENPQAESIRFCADVVHRLKGLGDGFHFMPVGMETKSPLLLDACFAPA